MKTNRTAIALVLVFMAMLTLPHAAPADEGTKLEHSKRPYADVKVILYGTSW